MILQALLVSKDELAAETLIQVLAQFGIAVDRSNMADVAARRLAEERFDEVIVDFDEPEAASLLKLAAAAGPDTNLRSPSPCCRMPRRSARFWARARISSSPSPSLPNRPEHLARCHGAAEARKTAIVAGRSPGGGFDSCRRSNSVEGILLDLSMAAWMCWRPSHFPRHHGPRLV